MNHKNWGWRGRLLYFIAKLYKFLENRNINKLQAAVPVLCWYFFKLNEITVVKKEKCMMGMHDQQVLARISSTKREQLV